MAFSEKSQSNNGIILCVFQRIYLIGFANTVAKARQYKSYCLISNESDSLENVRWITETIVVLWLFFTVCHLIVTCSESNNFDQKLRSYYFYWNTGRQLARGFCNSIRTRKKAFRLWKSKGTSVQALIQNYDKTRLRKVYFTL